MAMILLGIIISCNISKDSNYDKFSATLFMVCDNYPKGYKKHMGKMSYSRYLLFVFNVKNLTKDTIDFPSSFLYNDNCTKIRIYKENRYVDSNYTYYWKRREILFPNDSITVAVRLWESDLVSLGIDLDEDSIESIVPFVSFSYIPKSNNRRLNTHKEIIPIFIKSENITYYHGKLYKEIKNGKEILKEIYDEPDMRIIKKISEDNKNL